VAEKVGEWKAIRPSAGTWTPRRHDEFAHGYPCFAVSLGLEEAGELIVGVIFQPVSGELFTAVKGEGAYLNQKENRRYPKLKNWRLVLLSATGFPSVISAPRTQTFTITGTSPAFHGVRRDGSAAMEPAAVACGRSKASGSSACIPGRCRGRFAGARSRRHSNQFDGQHTGRGSRLWHRTAESPEMKEVAASIRRTGVDSTPAFVTE